MERIKENKELISRYLTLSVKQHFGVDVDVSNEYTFAENLVSKKMIIATTFTEKIVANPELKMFLYSLINELNNEKCSVDFIREKFDHLRESDSEEMEKIV
ncbi:MULTISPECIES: hypothetical protein [unclassified Chryseobacterium]|uniref:hypothetical protein n=1 Tax=unclassified Chryseobacterium TaxID=2593645 RepID=UPI0022699ABC|nr:MULTISPECIES: hypothetical protein [unclassified Chryseobacterium]